MKDKHDTREFEPYISFNADGTVCASHMFVHTALPPDDGRCYVKVTPAIQATWDRLSLDPALVASVQAARSALPLPPSSDLKMAGGAAIPVIPSVPAPDTPSVTQTYDEAQQAAVDALSAHGS